MKLRHLKSSLEVLQRDLCNSAQKDGIAEHNLEDSEPAHQEAPVLALSLKTKLKGEATAEKRDWRSNSFSCFLLMLLSHMNNKISISIYKEHIQSC